MKLVWKMERYLRSHIKIDKTIYENLSSRNKTDAPGPKTSDVMMMFPPGLPSLTVAALRILMVMAARQVAGP